MDALERIADDPITAPLYRELLHQVCRLGPIDVKAGTTALHLRRAGAPAFLGVHPRQGGLLLALVSDIRLVSTRVRKQEQVSEHRWHNEVLIHTGGELDAELLDWIEDAYALAAPAAG